jgi:hypothetical protein
VTDDLILDGEILCNGKSGSGGRAGSGAGGSIYIKAGHMSPPAAPLPPPEPPVKESKLLLGIVYRYHVIPHTCIMEENYISSVLLLVASLHVCVHLKVYDIYLYIATTKLTAMIYLKYC